MCTFMGIHLQVNGFAQFSSNQLTSEIRNEFKFGYLVCNAYFQQKHIRRSSNNFPRTWCFCWMKWNVLHWKMDVDFKEEALIGEKVQRIPL